MILIRIFTRLVIPQKDQRKWKVDGIWYKADYMGYEGLAEVLVSSLLGKSSLSYPFVAYQPVQIEYKGQMIRGCVSRDFLKEAKFLIPGKNCTEDIQVRAWQ